MNTYQKRPPVYESMEWDNTWIHRSELADAPRILYVGDSISLGTRSIANGLSDNPYFFDNFATSKALDNPYFFDSLTLFAAQEPEPLAVLFNNGHHGWHLTEEEYGVLYAEFLDQLLARYGKERVAILLTTYSLPDSSPNGRVMERNRIAAELAAERGLSVLDLYTVAEANRAHITDGVHFDGEGYEALARAIIRFLDEFTAK